MTKHSVILLPSGEYLDTSLVVSWIFKDAQLKFLLASGDRMEFPVSEAIGQRWCLRLAAERGGSSPLIPEPAPKPKPRPEPELMEATP
jgi:hypothetical protein